VTKDQGLLDNKPADAAVVEVVRIRTTHTYSTNPHDYLVSARNRVWPFDDLDVAGAVQHGCPHWVLL
jgi:hypothetical protein